HAHPGRAAERSLRQQREGVHPAGVERSRSEVPGRPLRRHLVDGGLRPIPRGADGTGRGGLDQTRRALRQPCRNIDPWDLRSTLQFLTVAMWYRDRCFPLARYRDPWRDKMGPEALARFLDLKVDEVFPISYDISSIGFGEPAVLAGKV